MLSPPGQNMGGGIHHPISPRIYALVVICKINVCMSVIFIRLYNEQTRRTTEPMNNNKAISNSIQQSYISTKVKRVTVKVTS